MSEEADSSGLFLYPDGGWLESPRGERPSFLRKLSDPVLWLPSEQLPLVWNPLSFSCPSRPVATHARLSNLEPTLIPAVLSCIILPLPSQIE